MIITGAEIAEGDRITAVAGVVLAVAPAVEILNSVRVTYSPDDRNDVLVGFWRKTELLEVTRASQD